MENLQALIALKGWSPFLSIGNFILMTLADMAIQVGAPLHLWHSGFEGIKSIRVIEPFFCQAIAAESL
jgi:hypothetical protein